MSQYQCDIVVVGGGHAGIEAALACARLGAKTILVTHDINDIGRMPCNPAIGGLGKGHLVKEIDLLGGEMGKAIDETGIQFRTLNLKKGPAVQSPRAQADKDLYQKRMMNVVLEQAGLEVVEDDACGLHVSHLGDVEKQVVQGVDLLSGGTIKCSRVVLCNGTFLKGLMHVGEDQTIGGREGSSSSEKLSCGLKDLGFELRRLKTGTPPRLLNSSIDYTQCRTQPGDSRPVPFSFRTRNFEPDQIDCHIAYTNETTHEIIRNSLERSPLFTGNISGQGPRYCPSIEDKVVRFSDKTSHLIYLEPESLTSNEVYVNGISTSLPADVQEAVVQSIPGLENAEILRMGYAIEYDSIPSWQIDRSLESKPVSGLFLAGQLLGTSGYEEAAAQGLVAGINSYRDLIGEKTLHIRRDQGYIGVLIDDLVTKEIDEPYRMFTSRAEHRLLLRCDNVEERLFDLSCDIGILSNSDINILSKRKSFIKNTVDLLKRFKYKVADKPRRIPLSDFFKFPGNSWSDLKAEPGVEDRFWDELDIEYNLYLDVVGEVRCVDSALFQIETDIRYEGYINKQNRLLHHQDHLDNLEIPDNIVYSEISALSNEAREKLAKVRPKSLGQAGRIDGVRAGDLAVLVVMVKKLRNREEG